MNLTLLIGNPMLKWLLRSPWHATASHEVLLITVIGRKTGKQYTTPVNYVRDGDVLSVLSHVHRTWWRNLRGGAPVKIVLQGKTIKTMATAYEDPKEVIEYYQKNEQMLNGVRNLAVEDQAIDLILSKAQVTEKEVAFDEVINKSGAAA